MIRRLTQILNPIGALLIIFVEYIVALGHILANHVDFIWISFGVNEVLAQGEPYIPEQDTRRARFLTPAA